MKEQFRQKVSLMERQLTEQKQQVQNSKTTKLSAVQFRSLFVYMYTEVYRLWRIPAARGHLELLFVSLLYLSHLLCTFCGSLALLKAVLSQGLHPNWICEFVILTWISHCFARSYHRNLATAEVICFS